LLDIDLLLQKDKQLTISSYQNINLHDEFYGI